MTSQVVGPRETLAELQKGASISRFGDGECKIILGQPMKFQRVDLALVGEMLLVLRGKHNASLTGVFHAHKSRSHGADSDKWGAKLREMGGEKLYHSALVTRPDTLPGWGETPAYFDAMASLWKGKRVTLIANGQRSLTPQLLLDEGAEGVDFIDCKPVDAYDEIDALEDRALAKRNHVILICAGPTASCLAERLAYHGRQALDLGHCGIFWRKYALIPKWHEKYRENSLDHGGNVIANSTYK